MNRKMRNMVGAMIVGLTGAGLMGDSTPGVAVTDRIEVKGSGRIDASDGDAVVSTNSTVASRITATGSGRIEGDAYCGPGGVPNSVITTSGSGQVTGVKAALSGAIAMPTISAPDLGASVGNRSYTNGTHTISASMRCGEFKVGGSSIVRVSGAVVIVADGEFKVEGSGRLEILEGGSLTVYAKDEFKVTNSGKLNENTLNPALCRVYVVGATEVKVEGSGLCYALIESEHAELSVTGSGELHGAFRGERATVEGSGLLRIDPGSGGGGVVLAMEVGRVTVGTTPQRVNFNESFTDPVVVCCVYSQSNTIPVIARVANVSATGFDLWLQNPGDLAIPVTDRVAWIAVESGAWEIDGVRLEAQKYTSTVTDRSGS